MADVALSPRPAPPSDSLPYDELPVSDAPQAITSQVTTDNASEPPLSADQAASQPPDAPAAQRAPERKRPRLDLNAGRRGNRLFGVITGTLNRAKIEDKERNASEAAKKRQSIDARLQAKISREQTIARKQEESKKEKVGAARKTEELLVKDGILKHRFTVIPHLSNFLLTTDTPESASSSHQSDAAVSTPLEHPPVTVSSPPTLYFLPKILTPEQEAIIERRKKAAGVRLNEERLEWETERLKGVEELKELKARSSEAERELAEAEKRAAPSDDDLESRPNRQTNDDQMAEDNLSVRSPAPAHVSPVPIVVDESGDVVMQDDDGGVATSILEDVDDAVEY